MFSWHSQTSSTVHVSGLVAWERSIAWMKIMFYKENLSISVWAFQQFYRIIAKGVHFFWLFMKNNYWAQRKSLDSLKIKIFQTCLDYNLPFEKFKYHQHL